MHIYSLCGHFHQVAGNASGVITAVLATKSDIKKMISCCDFGTQDWFSAGI
jgi:ABC-type uncharacterized transport system permease subunit